MSGTARHVESAWFHRNLGAALDEAHGGGALIVTAHGRPRVAVIGAREYEELLEAKRQLSWTRLALLVDPAPEPADVT